MPDERDPLKIIEEKASDAVELLKGLEATARIIHVLGMADNPLSIENEDVAHMMSSFREQLTTIRDSVEGIADMADQALIGKSKKVAAVK